MKWQLLIASLVLAVFVVGNSLPVDSASARDAGVDQALKSLDATKTVQPATQLDYSTFDKAVKSSDSELIAKKQKSKKAKKSKSAKKKKKKTGDKGAKGKATPSKTKKK